MSLQSKPQSEGASGGLSVDKIKDAIAEARVLWTAGQVETDDAKALVATHRALPSVDHQARHIAKSFKAAPEVREQLIDAYSIASYCQREDLAADAALDAVRSILERVLSSIDS